MNANGQNLSTQEITEITRIHGFSKKETELFIDWYLTKDRGYKTGRPLADLEADVRASNALSAAAREIDPEF